ncbi:MAG: hypothetical protein QOE35_1301 [Actinomycetota bacterium]|jgi:hypothetical protein
MGPRVALAVARADPDLHTDGPLLLAALDRVGIGADVVPWGDGSDWASYDGVLIRGTWDYILDREGFLAWAESVPRLANRAGVLRWNTDKDYLLDLEVAGIPIVPTTWVPPGDAAPGIDWDDFVVKPSVSAGARLSARYRRGDDIAAHVAAIHDTGSTAMVQPYLDAVDTTGETGTYVFGGEVSHAIRKGGILESGRAATAQMDAGSHQLVGPASVTPELAAFAQRVLAASPGVLYARVDTVPGPGGVPLLIELEVTEPFLFLEHDPPAADRFAAAVAGWLAAGNF